MAPSSCIFQFWRPANKMIKINVVQAKHLTKMKNVANTSVTTQLLAGLNTFTFPFTNLFLPDKTLYIVNFSMSPTLGGCGLGRLRSSPPSQGQRS